MVRIRAFSIFLIQLPLSVKSITSTLFITKNFTFCTVGGWHCCHH